MMIRTFSMYIALLAMCACSADHSSPKAVSDERAASNLVGGFERRDQALYHRGLMHIRNNHGRLGSFTIAQVIGDQRRREADLDEVAMDARSNASLRTELTTLNRLRPGTFHNGGISKDHCLIVVDAHSYDGSQDEEMLKKILVRACSGAYFRGHHASADGLKVRLEDLAGEAIYEDTLVKT